MASTTSRLTINNSFFDQLWPLILDENICDTKSKDVEPYFVPAQSFDELWAHTFLSSKNYGEYETPIDFLPRKCTKTEEEENNSEPTSPRRMSIEFDELKEDDTCEFERRKRIKRLDKQIREHENEQKKREELAYDFVNRTNPWYMPKPCYEFELTTDLLNLFTNPFERILLRTIHNFGCRFMIINLGPYNCWHHLETWVKFCKYLKIIIVVRKEELFKKLSVLNESIKPLLFEENLENTWQQELTRVLDKAIEFAEANKIMDNCTAGFVYVFSSRSTTDCLDRFRVLRKA